MLPDKNLIREREREKDRNGENMRESELLSHEITLFRICEMMIRLSVCYIYAICSLSLC